MATRTFTVTKASAHAVGDKFGYQRLEILRQNFDQHAYVAGSPLDLGGSDDVGILSASYVPVVEPRELTIDGDVLGGLTLEVVVYTRTESASGSVTVRVRNITDSSTAATSATITSTTLTKEVLTPTLASGAKVYRLEIIGGSASYAVYGFGEFRLRKVPA
jgi:hypothetical protein